MSRRDRRPLAGIQRLALRLARCVRGGTVEKLVLIGLGITMAAGASKLLEGGAKHASETISARTQQGGAGH